MRIDKVLWCVRLAKTRSIAADECARGHVRINERDAKPSVEVRIGDVVAVRVAPIWRSYEVLAMPASRMGAKLVPTYLAERTAWEDLERLEIARKVRAADRTPGSGRPTKRERRDIDRFAGE